MLTTNAGELPLYHPLRVAGPGGQHAFVGHSTIWFKGNTGLVGTAFGLPGAGATRASTGVYNLFFPKTQPNHGVIIKPSIEIAPSGVHLDVRIQGVGSSSGTAQMKITSAGASGNLEQFANPPTGTKIHLEYHYRPITPY